MISPYDFTMRLTQRVESLTSHPVLFTVLSLIEDSVMADMKFVSFGLKNDGKKRN